MNNRLKPCPFCEGDIDVIDIADTGPSWLKAHRSSSSRWIWRCRKCGAANSWTYSSRQEAVAAANRRAGDELNERIRGALEALPLDIVTHCCGRCSGLGQCYDPESAKFEPECGIAYAMELANEILSAFGGCVEEA